MARIFNAIEFSDITSSNVTVVLLLLQRFFTGFNRLFERATNGYVHWSGALLRKSVPTVGPLAAAVVAGVFFAGRVPSSFLPDEDQGYLYVNMQLPNSASIERTAEAAEQVEKILADTPGGEYTTSVVGFSPLSFVRTSYNRFFFVTLKPWDKHTTREEQFQEIKAHLNANLSKLPEGIAFSFSPPAIPGVGTSGVRARRPRRPRRPVSGGQSDRVPGRGAKAAGDRLDLQPDSRSARQQMDHSEVLERQGDCEIQSDGGRSPMGIAGRV